MPVAIVTDTTAYLTPELLREHAIGLVSLYVTWPDRTERESELDGLDGFYRELASAQTLPTTSQPSIGDFLEVWEPLLENGGEIVSVHLSGGISGTVQSAEQARERLMQQGIEGDRIHVVDSQTACAGQGLVVLSASAAARQGKSGAQVAAHARAARSELKLWFAVDTLEYLRRGGRIGAASAWLGSTLKIKPILSVEGEIAPVERVRTQARARERMVDYARDRAAAGAVAYSVQHIQAPDELAALRAQCEQIYGTDPVYTSEIGPVIGTHTGPGLLGMGALPPRFLES